MTPGTVLYDDSFKFSDSSTGQKILVVLNDGNQGFYIVVKTTSKSKYKGVEVGCQSEERYPNFFIAKESTLLSEDTWALLDQFFEFRSTDLLAKSFSGQIKHLGALPNAVIIDLLICCINCDDISQSQKGILTEVVEDISK